MCTGFLKGKVLQIALLNTRTRGTDKLLSL
jgi:hypothetical protein